MIKCINRELPSINGAQVLPLFIQQREPLEPGPRGMMVRTVIKSSQTNYQFACVEGIMAPKKMGPAPHIHEHLDEITFVLEGTMGNMVDEKVIEIPAGGFSIRPHGMMHCFWNASDKPCRFLEMYCNQNFDEYLEELFYSLVPDMVKNNLTAADPGIKKRSDELHKEFGAILFPEKRNEIVEKYGLVP
jgi:uncharacterized cupin superfamily protein